MNDQQHITDESFDDLARSAGAALRRPAPADGVQSIRTARRRQQQTRAALGGAALAAIVAVGAAVTLRDDPETIVVEQPEDTTPATVAPTVPGSSVPTTPTTAPTTTAPVTAPVTAPPTVPVTAPIEPVSGLSAEAVAWRDARIAEGFTLVDILPGDGTTARMLTAQRPDPQGFAGAVLFDDGRVVDLPARITDRSARLHGVGGSPAVVEVEYDGNLATTTQVWIVDPRTDEWAATGDLGFTPRDSSWGGVTVRSVGDALLVADNSYVLNADGSLSVSPDQRGVVIRGDLSITEMTPAPDGVALFFTSTSGGKALQLYGPAVEGGNSLDVSYDQPWQYDPTANEWSEIPLPDWMDCSGLDFGCPWVIVPDIGSTELEVPTERGVVALVPDGTVGVYDAAASAWTRLDDPPFTLTMPSTAIVGDQVVVAPFRSGGNDFTQIGVLDLATGTWTTNRIEIPSDIEARFDTEWFDVSWDLRTAGSRVLAVPGPSFRPSTADPIAVYDVATGTWSTPTEADLANWDALATSFTA